MVNARQKKQKKRLMLEDKSQKTQVIVCYICGDKGFTNALIDCSKCSDKVAHQYCLGMVPGSIDDTITWLCEFCSMAPMASESAVLTMSDGVSAKDTEEICRDYLKPLKPKSENDMLIADDQPEPLQIVLPVSYNTSFEQTETSNKSDDSERIPSTSSASIVDDILMTSPLKQPADLFSESVLLVSPSGEVFISKHMNLCDASSSHSLAPLIGNMTIDGIENEPSGERDEKI